jgi:hypothetical protein
VEARRASTELHTQVVVFNDAYWRGWKAACAYKDAQKEVKA